jgi:hypothetical protein
MESWGKLSPKERERRETEGLQAWVAWMKKQDKSILDGGSPLGRTKRTNRKGIANVRNELTAYTLVEATSHAAAAKLFRNHPHFMFFPGDSVEIMECLPIPEM